MKKVKLGNTKLKVSRMSIGTDTMQNLSIKEGAELMVIGYKKGLTFWDTSDDYGSHPQLKVALDKVGRKNVVVTTKIMSRSYKQAQVSLAKCLKELGTKYVDIILLHAVDSVTEFHNRSGALKYLLEAKKKGLVKVVGLSTHNANMAKYCATQDKIEVILATINYRGNHVHGGLNNMKKAMELNHKNGKGVYAMKVLGRGSIKDIERAIAYVKKLDYIDSLCIGVQNKEQLKEDIKIFESI